MKKDTIWTIILIVSLFLIIHGMSNAGSKDKKTAQAAQDEATAGAIGTIAFIMKKRVAFLAGAGVLWIVIPAIALLAAPLGINLWRGVLSPPSIPSWVWIAGFALLFIMMMKRRD